VRRGRIIIDFESNEEGDCNFIIKQDRTEKLNDEDLVSLFEHIIREIMPFE